MQKVGNNLKAIDYANMVAEIQSSGLPEKTQDESIRRLILQAKEAATQRAVQHFNNEMKVLDNIWIAMNFGL